MIKLLLIVPLKEINTKFKMSSSNIIRKTFKLGQSAEEPLCELLIYIRAPCTMSKNTRTIIINSKWLA